MRPVISMADFSASPRNGKTGLTRFPAVKEITEQRLTQQETIVLRCIAEGRASQEVANYLYISKRTVDFHLAHIYRKFGVRNRMQAVNKARAAGILH